MLPSLPAPQVDYLHDLLGVTHTPTFAIYKKGTKVGGGADRSSWKFAVRSLLSALAHRESTHLSMPV